MKQHLKMAGAIVALASALLFGLAASPKPVPAPADAFAMVKRLGRGVNVLGYDPIWKHPKKARFEDRHFKLIREAGFETVRINLHALQRMGKGPDHRLPERWLKTLDGAIDGAQAAGLNVILDLHNYNDVAKDPAAFKPRLLAFWKQIGERYRDAPDTLLFELLNEPNGRLTAALWNAWLPEVLAVVRATNPTRMVVLGPAEWNGFRYLDALVLPESDRSVIVTVHYYDPHPFTHQGAPWEPETAKLAGLTWGAPQQEARLAADFDAVQAWSKAHGRPILLGEFGAYEKAPMESRVRWTAAVARAAEARGWAWAYWQFDSDFIVYDIDKGRWVGPILGALIPK
jgi:endoglucanase